MPYSYDSGQEVSQPMKLFGRHSSIHALLGGGKVADLLLWRNKRASAAFLIGITVIWFLFEVVEYNLVTLLCHLSITAMLVVFIWCTSADSFKWTTPPKVPELILDEHGFKQVASIFHTRFNQIMCTLLDIACGNDLPLFFLAIFSLWILSVIGTYFSFLNLLFLGLLSMETLPFLYERYGEDVDNLAGEVYHQVNKLYRKFDSNVLNKIPRVQAKEKKFS